MSKTAKDQYAAFLKNGVENTPFYACPYKDLLAWKGPEKTLAILTHYQRIHKDTPCVKNGVLLLSYAKHLTETNED